MALMGLFLAIIRWSHFRVPVILRTRGQQIDHEIVTMRTGLKFMYLRFQIRLAKIEAENTLLKKAKARMGSSGKAKKPSRQPTDQQAVQAVQRLKQLEEQMK